jgi:hypothetical protein
MTAGLARNVGEIRHGIVAPLLLIPPTVSLVRILIGELLRSGIPELRLIR